MSSSVCNQWQPYDRCEGKGGPVRRTDRQVAYAFARKFHVVVKPTQISCHPPNRLSARRNWSLTGVISKLKRLARVRERVAGNHRVVWDSTRLPWVWDATRFSQVWDGLSPVWPGESSVVGLTIGYTVGNPTSANLESVPSCVRVLWNW